MGKMRVTQKSELLQCLEKDSVHEHPVVDTLILDGAAIVNMVLP